MTIPVDVPCCSYCFQVKGRPHSETCTRPGLAAEIVAAQKRTLYTATRCRDCGTPLIEGRCPTDWCPSHHLEKAAETVGTNVRVGCGMLVFLVKVAVLGTVLWLCYRAWTGSL